VPSKAGRSGRRKREKDRRIPLPSNNAELKERLNKEILERTKSYDKVTKTAKAAGGSLFATLMTALAFLGTTSLSHSEVNAIWFLVGISGPMSFAFPIIVFKVDYLRARMKKSPDWLIELLWGPYMAICGIAFLFFALALVFSTLIDWFTISEIVWILLVSGLSFAMAIRARRRRNRRDDTQMIKKGIEQVLDSKMGRIAYGVVIGATIYILPVSALLLQPVAITLLRGSLILALFAPLLVWAMLSFLAHQLYFIHIEHLRTLAEKVEADGEKCFDTNQLAFSNILRYGNLSKDHIRKSRHGRRQGKGRTNR